MKTNNESLMRHTGLLILEVNMSNPNGDPDMDSEPRTRELDGLGMISPVSLKRKYRDLVGEKSEVFKAAKTKLQLDDDNFRVLEMRGRDRKDIINCDSNEFKKRYWDARLFGNTFLEALRDKGKLKETGFSEEEINKIEEREKKGDFVHFINTGTLQIGVGLSVAPINVIRKTYTNKSGVERDKDQGMAPLGFRVVQHAIYYIPFFVNPSVAAKTGATKQDLDLFKFMTPYVYSHTASAIRPQINILHAWCIEHNDPLGSCPDYLLIDALTPKIKQGIDRPLLRSDYEIPTFDKLDSLKNRVKKIEDLCEKAWN